METVTKEIILKVHEDLYSKSEDDLVALVNKMSDEQPFILTYLTAVSEQLEIDEEQEIFFFTGLAVWQMMSLAGPKLPKVSDKVLDEAEKRNESMLKYFEGEIDDGFVSSAQNFLQGYNQPHLLYYVEETIFEEDDDGEMISEPAGGIFFFYLKTVIDAMDA